MRLRNRRLPIWHLHCEALVILRPLQLVVVAKQLHVLHLLRRQAAVRRKRLDDSLFICQPITNA